MDELLLNSIDDALISIDYSDCNDSYCSLSNSLSGESFCDDDFESEPNFYSFYRKAKKLTADSNIVAYLKDHCRFKEMPKSQLGKRKFLDDSSIKSSIVHTKKKVPNIKDVETWLANDVGQLLQDNTDEKIMTLEDFIRHPSSIEGYKPELEIKEEKSEAEIKVEKLLTLSGCNAVSFLQRFCQKNNRSLPVYVECAKPKGQFFGYFYSVALDGVEYICEKGGPNKKAARQMAAKNFLSKFLILPSIFSQINNEEDLKNAFFLVKQSKPVNVIPSPITVAALNNLNLLPENDLFSKIGRLMTKKFAEILSDSTYSLQNSVPKVFSGFCLRDSIDDSIKVICVTTGNQCITGEKIKLDGSVLNDCHAEILARRCLIRYLFARLTDQIQLNSSFDDGAMFEKTQKGIFKLKERYSFHLYISSAPCGDGRVFAFSEHSQSDQMNGTQNRIHSPSFLIPRKNGLLRCKIERGEGGTRVPENFDDQTIDGINGGERLYTMSCSDKILKWNVLGLQGTLLASFIEPIYLSSLTVGSLYRPGHLSRAICCRLNGLDGIPEPFKLNHPLHGQGGVDAPRNIQKPKSICFNWIDDVDVSKFERLDGGSGMTLAKQKSRLCKAQMFSLYKLWKQKIALTSSAFTEIEVDDEFYYDAKMKNVTYQRTKKVFFEALKERNYGAWLNKPTEEKKF